MPPRPGQGPPKHVAEQRAVARKINARRIAFSKAQPSEKSDQQLISEAISAGKVTRCKPGFAVGASPQKPFQLQRKRSGEFSPSD